MSSVDIQDLKDAWRIPDNTFQSLIEGWTWGLNSSWYRYDNDNENNNDNENGMLNHIHFVQNRAGKTRLAKWYIHFEDEEKQKLIEEVDKCASLQTIRW